MQKLKILLGFDIWEAGFWGFCWEIRVKESWFERKFPWQWVSVLGYVHAQFIFNGLNLYLGSQLICTMGFEFLANPKPNKFSYKSYPKPAIWDYTMRKREIGEREWLRSREEKITVAMVVASDGRKGLEVRPAMVCEREINFF